MNKLKVVWKKYVSSLSINLFLSLTIPTIFKILVLV